MNNPEMFSPVNMVRLGLATLEERKEYEDNKIDINKRASRISSEAAKNAKRDTCFICNKPCSSFCNSHSVPSFAIQRIAQKGKVLTPLHGEVPALGRDFGVKQAGVFHLICNACDNTLFQDYENPAAYDEPPTDKMLAQIAFKDYLLMISRRNEEKETYKLLGEKYPNHRSFTEEKIYIGDYDLRGYHERLLYAKKAMTNRLGKRYYLCYFRELDYVVPYASQAPITMISDFEDGLINDLYNFNTDYKMKEIHIAVFPLAQKSVVLAFVEDGEKRYRKFCRQLKKLSEEDQLAAINYILFSYSENIFLNPEVQRSLKSDEVFMDICRKSTDFTSSFPVLFEDPLKRAMKEFSLSRRHEIPNLLSKEFALG